MVSKNDLIVGVLVFIAGIVIYGFAPSTAAPGGGFIFQGGAAHPTSHYLGGTLAIVFGIVGLALYKKVGRVAVGVAVLSLFLGLVFVLDAPGGPLYAALTPHPLAMATTGALTILVGLVGIVAAVALKPKK